MIREKAMDDDNPTKNMSVLQSSGWPSNGAYFVPNVMEAEGALNLLQRDAQFHEPDSKSTDSLTVLDIAKSGTSKYTLSVSDDQFESRLRMADLEPGGTRIISVSHKRRFFENYSVNTYQLKLSTWLKILSSGEIIPDVVETLHENNGGWGVHTSDCSDAKRKSCIANDSGSPQNPPACAFHIWIKPRLWWKSEHFLYARHDCHTDNCFILLAGSSVDLQMQRLSVRFDSPNAQPHLFSILLGLTTSWTRDLQQFLWSQDFATQKLESDTGWSIVGHTQLKPLPREKLAIHRDLVISKDLLSHVVRASDSFCELFQFLSQKMRCLPLPHPSPNSQLDQLEDAFQQLQVKQWHSRMQANALLARIDAQWNVVNALVSQHNTGLNHQIASDSRTDTVIMRRISFVTMAFLPATFLATFFSMTFFDFNLGGISVSPMIWIYFVCTIPVTLVIAWQSSNLQFSRIWKGRKEKPVQRPSFNVIRQGRRPVQSEMQQMA